MKKEYDFSRGKRGPVLPIAKGKTRITIRLDEDLVAEPGVPSRSWEWDEGMSRSGVHTSEGKLVWWNRPFGDGGRFCEVATEQSFEAFVESGAPVFVPDLIERELRALILSVG